MQLNHIQDALREEKVDGWLFYDFRNQDPLSYRILGLNFNVHHTRRWYYFIPVSGTPHKIVSAVEPGALDSLPGEKHVYLSLKQKKIILSELFSSNPTIVMNYSPMNDVPYVSMVDGGTLEFIRSFGCTIQSAQNLIQTFEGLVKEEAFETHRIASKLMHSITDRAFQEIGHRIREGIQCRELDIHQFIQNLYAENNLVSLGSPEVAINVNAADPHYSPSEDGPTMKLGDLVLIDSWAKLDQPGAIYYDITWMAYIGEEIPERIQSIWTVVKAGRDAAIAFERKKLELGVPCYGWEVDNVCRAVIEKAGFGEYFVHRTGHSIGQEVHGNAVHIDGLETKDTRQVVPYVLHSIEPGIYIPNEKIGIRSEVDVYVDTHNQVIVTGPIQEDIVKILP
ncbi:MAG: M24 family metallopeptidase [Promethearchaeota archaeon]